MHIHGPNMDNLTSKRKISVITVSFNAVKTIETTILSVLNQSYSNVEYVVIDGGSTDGTVDILKKYSKEISFWISEPDEGIYDAMNKALKIANGDWCIFLGADDVFFSKDTISNIIHNFNEDAVYYGDSYITKLRKIYWGKFNSYKLAIGNICHQSIFYPKSVYKNKRYNAKYRIYADYVYNMELFSQTKFVFLNETICIFNYDGISSTQNDSNFDQDKKSLIINNLGVLQYIFSRIYIILRNLH